MPNSLESATWQLLGLLGIMAVLVAVTRALALAPLPLSLPCICPISPLHLPYISPTSAQAVLRREEASAARQRVRSAEAEQVRVRVRV